MNHESLIHKAIMQEVFWRENQDPEWSRIYHPPNGEKRDGLAGVHLQLMGLRRGVWDICYDGPRLLLLDGQWQLRMGLRIEVKHYRYKKENLTAEKRLSLLTPEQAGWLTFYRANFLHTAIVVTQEEGVEVLKWYLQGVPIIEYAPLRPILFPDAGLTAARPLPTALFPSPLVEATFV